MSSFWDTHQLKDKILTILKEVKAYDSEHHLGRPFITPYQLAVLFKQEYKDDYEALAKMLSGSEEKAGVGGKGHGEYSSPAQYLARELSRRCTKGPNAASDFPVEGAFLYRKLVKTISYMDGQNAVESSLGTQYDLSLFRVLN